MNKSKAVAHGLASLPGLLYVLSPLDLVPDIIPVAGQVDDGMAVIATLLVNVLVFMLLRAYAPEVFEKKEE